MMTELKFMEEMELDAKLFRCPHCGEEERIGVHNRKERLLKCHGCGKSFGETKGTVFENLHYPKWVVILILRLIGHGCPIPAIVASFFIDSRTVESWHEKAGKQGKRVQEQIVCNGQVELGQVQADEMRVKTQKGTVWMASSMTVFSRLFIWGEVSTSRDKSLIRRLFEHVAQAASSSTAPVLVAVDGFAAYPKAILAALHTKQRTGRPGRPAHIPWPDLHIVQVVKSAQGRRLAEVSRRLFHGTWQTVYALIGMSQLLPGSINTAYIERLNATFRARIPSLVRRTRNLACTTHRLEYEMFWLGVLYNFSTLHDSLAGTPAMAAGLTDHLWSVEELLSFNGPRKSLPVLL
jgi:transposase-like protein/IS1 family transposase